jgi:hypothetical protein
MGEKISVEDQNKIVDVITGHFFFSNFSEN